MAKRGNGEGTIWKNEERRRWEGRITIGTDDTGKLIRRKVTGRTRNEVVARLKELNDATEAGTTPARRDLTVGRFLDDWLEDVLPGTVARSTETNYHNIVEIYLKPRIGRKRLRTLQARDVSRMLRKMAEDDLSPNTQRLARSVLRRALRWAEAEGMVSRNVAAIANGVKIGTREGKSLSPEQARQLLTYLADTSRGEKSPPTPSRLEAAFTVALSLGLRRGELLGLSWDDLDLEATPPRLTVRLALKRHPAGLVLEEPKTRQSRRTVHLPAPAVAALKRHRAKQAEERLKAGELWELLPLGADLVFRTELGTSMDPDNFRNITYKLTDDAGIGKWSPHSLRHSAASLLLAQGVPLKVISEVLGHSSIRVTADVYSHLMEPAKTEAADAMTTALWGTT